MKIAKILIALVAICLFDATEAETILTIGGKSPDGSNKRVELSMADLDALEQTRIETLNNYLDGLTVFTGPKIQLVLDGFAYDVASEIKATAINDYFVTIPATDFLNGDVILATRRMAKKCRCVTKVRSGLSTSLRSMIPIRTQPWPLSTIA